jgi:hypothetical protein
MKGLRIDKIEEIRRGLETLDNGLWQGNPDESIDFTLRGDRIMPANEERVPRENRRQAVEDAVEIMSRTLDRNNASTTLHDAVQPNELLS